MRAQVLPGQSVRLDEPAGTKRMTYIGLQNPRGRTFIRIDFNYILDAEEQDRMRMLHTALFGTTYRIAIKARVGLTVVELGCSGAARSEFNGTKLATDFADWAPEHHRKVQLEEQRKQRVREEAFAKVAEISGTQAEGTKSPSFQSAPPAPVTSIEDAPIEPKPWNSRTRRTQENAAIRRLQNQVDGKKGKKK